MVFLFLAIEHFKSLTFVKLSTASVSWLINLVQTQQREPADDPDPEEASQGLYILHDSLTGCVNPRGGYVKKEMC